MRRIALALSLACLGASTVTTPAAAAAFPGSNGVIAYTAYLGNQSDICVMEPDGSNPRILVAGPSDQHQPAWSPDGSKLAYTDYADGPGRIKVLDLTTGTTSDLGLGYSPAWSPTGQELAFSEAGLWIVSADGTNRHQIDAEGAESPAWSPDGTQILFYDDIRDGVVDEGGVWSIAPEGSEPVRISDGGPASWSPDGTQIVADAGFWQMVIWIMNADGSDQRFLFEGSSPFEVSGSTWSPDGSTIAFNRSIRYDDHTTTDIWTIPAGGGTAQALAETPNPDFDPDWQPVTSSTPVVPTGGPCVYELHDRSVTFRLKRHLVATGRVTAPDGYGSCASGWVSVFRRNDGGWKPVGSKLANQEGRFRVKLDDRPGRYRAVVEADLECDSTESDVRRHRH